MRRVVRVGLVGLGAWSEFIVKGVEKSEKLELISCFSRTEEERKKFAREHHCRPAGSYEEMIKDKDIDAVLLITPNHTHIEQTVLAAKYNKHVFVDKPLANTVKNAKKMIQTCRENKVILSVGHQSRRRAEIREIKSLIERGRLGKIVSAEANNSHGAGLHLASQQWRWDERICPALPLMQWGIHQIDNLIYLLGSVRKIFSFMGKIYFSAPNKDTTATLLEFSSGTLGYLGSNYVTPSLYYLNLYGTKANVFYDLYKSGLYIQKSGKTHKEKITTKQIDPVLEELEEFADCIRENKEPEVGGEEALQSLVIVQAAIKSNESGKPVKIKEYTE